MISTLHPAFPVILLSLSFPALWFKMKLSLQQSEMRIPRLSQLSYVCQPLTQRTIFGAIKLVSDILLPVR